MTSEAPDRHKDTQRNLILNRAVTDRVDRETVDQIVSTLNSIQFFDRAYDVDLTAAASTLRALLAERDALEAENKRLRDALAVCSDPTRRDAHSVARATLAEQEKTDDQ